MVAEPIVGVVIRIAVEFVRRAVEVFATAFGVDQDHDARTAAVLGVEVAGEGLEFAHSVQAQRRVLAVVRAYVGVDDAVEEEVVCRAAHAVDVKVIGLVEDKTELRVVVGDDAWQRGQQRLKIPSVQWLFRNLPLVDDGRIARSRGINQRGLRCDGHRL